MFMSPFMRFFAAVFAAAFFYGLNFAVSAATAGDEYRESLAGEWRFEMDRDDVGGKEQWFARDLKDRIKLPGILQGQGYGDDITVDTPWVAKLPRNMNWYLLPQYKAYTVAGNVKMPYLSQPPKHYLGVAWYQRDIDIPAAWKGKREVLTLERPHWETVAFVDNKQIGWNTSLVAPHIYDLGTLTPGKHTLSIRIDNRMILNYRPDGHSVSDAEGAAWNGIVGKIELAATSPVWIEDAATYPNVENKSVLVKVEIGNATGKAGSGKLVIGAVTTPVTWDAKGGKAEINVPLGADARTWSEYMPVLQHLTVKLAGEGEHDRREVTFGLREIKADGKRILLNGTPIEFRATHDGGGFPLTGYPATDVESWKRIIGICKAWGLNGMRFHSWCPPDAAFTAADELGFYLQPECGMWNLFDADGQMFGILDDETARIMKAYGNHPSFILLGATNEPAGQYQDQLGSWDEKWRKTDPRRLYSDGTGRSVTPQDGEPFPSDFIITSGLMGSGQLRGPRGWFGADYEAGMSDLPIPAIAHELGQWEAYPNFDVIKKYTGYLQPSNFEVMRDSAKEHGLLANNKELAYASGKFQVECYKEEIEANLRTPSFSGFDLLDLHDYMGQGTALVGLLDPFWETKGYVTAAEFRRFCNATVPLARLQKRVYTTAGTLKSNIEIAHFGPAPLKGVNPEWRIEDANGDVAAKGSWPALDVPIGKGTPLGSVTADLSKLAAPRVYKLIVGLRGTDIENDWSFWVYPAQVSDATPADVLVTSAWADAEARLAAGGKVLFQPTARDMDQSDPVTATTPIFWNRVMNGSSAWMLGMWCDAKHPALAGFPTESNNDWQWVDIIHGARALNLDTLPRELQPIVQPIDDWSRNEKFGLIYECKVGAGRLMVCSIDLGGAEPGAKALRRSLLDYMGSERFQPETAVQLADLRKQWTSTRGEGYAGPGIAQPVIERAPEVDAPAQIPAPKPGN